MRLPDKIVEFRVTKLRDEHAYGVFYEDTYPQIKKYLASRVENKEVAEDITHEAFVELWHIIFVRKEEVRKSLRGFLFLIAKRRLMDHYRRKSKSPTYIDEYIEQSAVSNNFLSELEVGSEMGLVRNCLVKLAPTYREVITLRYLDGLEFEEISAIMEKTSGTVRVLLHRALKELRDELGKTLEE